jgi:3-hydroxyacyl-[acyl-carrier-protein] dehydratase
MRHVRLAIAVDHPAFDGHFPGRPLLPGVALLAEVLEALLDDAASACRLGPEPRLGAAKFLAPVLPGARLELRFGDGVQTLRFEVHEGTRLVASGHFEAAAGVVSAPGP